MARPTPEQLSKINKFAKTPLSADDVYVHPFRLLGTGYIPSRYLQFDPSLLEIYLNNVNNGDVAQIADHSFGNGFIEKITLPFGRFFEGELVADGDKVQLDGSMFMPQGAKTYIQDFTTDDISQQIDAGILHDSSVSVSWGYSECSICHNDIRDYEQCRHYPGRYYDVEGGAQRVLCTVIAKPRPVNDSSCMIENSIVCAGAYPDAGVLGLSTNGEKPSKTENMVKLNNIADLKLVNKDAPVFCCLSSTSATFQIESESLRDASELHQIYHQMYSEAELPEGWTMAKLTAKHKEAVKELLDAGHEHLMADALDGTLNEALKAKSMKGSEIIVDEKEKLALEGQIDALSKENEQFKTDLAAKDTEITELKAKVDELTPQAELGKQYREDTIAAALASGVRDIGNDFEEETYKKMFAALSIDEIKAIGEKWEASALARLGIPDSKTKGENIDLPGEGFKQTVDPELYKVGR